MFGFLRNRNSQLSEITQAIALLVKQKSDADEKESERVGTSERLRDAETAIEGLQLRQEQLKEECLRYLQKGSQRMKRAEELAESDEEQMAPVGLPNLPFPEQAQEDDASWARRLLRERGETPV